jgi:hypothetical protein
MHSHLLTGTASRRVALKACISTIAFAALDRSYPGTHRALAQNATSTSAAAAPEATPTRSTTS